MRNKLTALAIRKAPDGKLFDGAGLILNKSGDSGKWVFRYSHLKKRREMGLGGWPALPLAEARDARDKWAALLASGVDPITARDADRADEIKRRDSSDPTFAEMVDTVFDIKKHSLRGGGKRGRWRSPLDLHVIPKIGHKRISEITQIDIRDCLKSIWRTKHPTAEKAIQRTRIVFDEARYSGVDCDAFVVNAAIRLLGEVHHETQHIAATHWRDIPALWNKLDPNLSAGLCLRWMVLTLVRFDGCRAASVPEINGDTWTVPKDRIKAREGKAHDFGVPLSSPAMQIAESARKCGHDLIFAGHRGRPISSRAVELYMDRIGEPGRPHGLRTAFRTWVQDNDVCSYEVAETILGHKIGSTVERSYARSDLLERRRPVMEEWAKYIVG